MSTGITVAASYVGLQTLAGYIGDFAYDAPDNTELSCVNAAGQATQVSTVTVDTATASTVYTITIDGVTVSVTAPSSGQTTTTIAAQLLAALQADGWAGGRASFSALAAVITLTATTPGLGGLFTISSSALTTTATTTAAAAAGTVPFGRCLVGTGNNVDSRGTQTAAVPTTAVLTAQVDVVTVVYAAAQEYMVQLTFAGVPYAAVKVVATVDSTATAAAIVTALNLVLPANTILAASALGVITLTSEIKGQSFVTGIGSLTGANIALTSSTSNTATTDINKCFRGISGRASYIPFASVSAPAEIVYPANALMRVKRKGQVFVASAEAISQFDPVYVETTIGADAGKFYKTSSSTRVLLDRRIAVWVNDSSDADKAVIQIAA